MAFEDNIKKITPELTDIVSNTPAVKVGDKVLVAGIGGNFIPGAMGADAYVVVDDNGVLKAQKLSFNGAEASFDGTAETLDATKVGLFATTQDEPAYKGGGSAFYKCASVDTTAKTWTGYLAVLGEDGTYSYEETVTEGLAFGAGFTPEVGKIYNGDATVQVTKLWDGYWIPTDNLIFYAPLSESKATAETGQQLNTSGSVIYTTVNGVGVGVFSNSRIDTVGTIGISGNATVTLSAWLKTDSGHTTTSAVNIGSNSAFSMFAIGENDGKAFVSGYAADYTSDISITDRIHHVAASYTGEKIILYVDGVKIHEYSASLNITSNTLCIGASHELFNYDGYIAAVRVYDRVLSEQEIVSLSREFNPTA